MMKLKFRILVILAILVVVLSACAPSEAQLAEESPVEQADIDCMGVEKGAEISMVYQWSGDEEEKFNRILQPFVDACDVKINPETMQHPYDLERRVYFDTPPDVAFWPFWNVKVLEPYQGKMFGKYLDQLFPMTELGVHEENYDDLWVNLGSINDQWLALPVKAHPKTLIWYSPAKFEEFGYSVPDTWDGLNNLVEQMVADDRTPWSMGIESGETTGWTGTDFIQDIILVKQGPDFVRGIIDSSVPYNDPRVQEAWEIYGEWATNSNYTPNGADGTLSTGVNDAILSVFSEPPEALMVKQSGLAGASITETYPDLEYGTDYGFFVIPDAQGLQVGSDWMLAFNDSPAVQALVAYLSSELGGQTWAEVGFELTLNLAGRDNYPDQVLKDMANILYNASDLVPDIGDTIPPAFGEFEFAGVTDYINGSRDLEKILNELVKVQKVCIQWSTEY